MCSNPCESEVTCFRPESNRGPYGLLIFLCAALSTTEKNNQPPQTAHYAITTARRPDNTRSSALVQSRSTKFMARPNCEPRSVCCFVLLKRYWGIIVRSRGSFTSEPSQFFEIGFTFLLFSRRFCTYMPN